MRLKVITSSLVVMGVALLLLWPFVIGAKPGAAAPRKELAAYGARVLMYFGGTCVVWLGAAASAFLLTRQTRLEFLEQTAINLRGLVEGSTRDHSCPPDA